MNTEKIYREVVYGVFTALTVAVSAFVLLIVCTAIAGCRGGAGSAPVLIHVPAGGMYQVLIDTQGDPRVFRLEPDGRQTPIPQYSLEGENDV